MTALLKALLALAAFAAAVALACALLFGTLR